MTSKEARLAAVSPSFEAGNIYLPKFASWTPDVIHELTAFPNAKHDDIVDACVYAVSQFSAAHSSFDKITALARR
jgi:predicted phage terminase large subunit-like protein